MARTLISFAVCLLYASFLTAQRAQDASLFPPRLPENKSLVSDTSPLFLKPPETLAASVRVAQTAPRVDFAYYPGQTYPGRPWSNWGQGCVVGDVFYSAIGDHHGPEGTARVFAYDSRTGQFRIVVDVRTLLNLPKGHYTPGKIHSHLTAGKDGCIYFSTHRGPTNVTTPQYHYKGDWIIRYNPKTDRAEIVVHAPLPNQCMPTGLLDPERMIFYAGTADGNRAISRVMFLAYDVLHRKVLYSDEAGPGRAMILARSTGKVYFHPGPYQAGRRTGLVCFDPAKPGKPTPVTAELGLRAATEESPDGKVYTVDQGHLWEFDTRRETARHLGKITIGQADYITSLALDPKTWRYIYFVAGAHGGAERDGSPLVQYDTKTGTSKVIAFLHPFYWNKYGYIPMGSYGLAVSPEGDKVYITWNGHYGGLPPESDKPTPFTFRPLPARADWNICALTVIHIPALERQP
ncbi:MAG: hypothetical protein RMI91_01870 [Gemmatales bacterium]|nr:hypothetical protein [Gemmatales bacterium]MDW7993374.1 hypothetical protein [Gemmatales bacterium]